MALLFAHPGEEFYLSQIGDVLGKRPGVFQRGINALEREGVIVSRKHGNQRLFSVNERYALMTEVRGIVNKTCGVEGSLREFVNNVKQVVAAIIYGSYARDALSVNSDIDLLLVTTSDSIEDGVITAVAAIERSIQREINCTIYLRKEFERKRRGNDAFLATILNEPYILLKGSI